MEVMCRERDESWETMRTSMMDKYDAFVRDSGASRAGRFRGGMPSKFLDR